MIRIVIAVLLELVLTQSKLVQVVSMFRHGARYHLNSLYDGNTTLPYWGELTGVGMKQHQSLGDTLRKQYVDNLGFLSAKYDPAQVEVYSTLSNRTIQSVISQLYGLYPLGTGPRLLLVDKQYHLPPYTNTTDDIQQNYALPNAYQFIPIKYDQHVLKTHCNNQYDQFQKNKQIGIAEYNQMNNTYYPFIKKMIPLFNLSTNATLETIEVLSGDLEVDEHLGRKFPANFTDDDWKNMKHLRSWNQMFKFGRDLAKAYNKHKFEKIISMFDSRVRSSSQPMKWTFLSAHDSDMAPMYLNLNLTSSTCVEELYRKGSTSALNCEGFPLFASSLIWELHQDDKRNFTVKIRSNGKYMKLCETNSEECKYEEWKKRITAGLGTEQIVNDICGKVTSSVQYHSYPLQSAILQQ